MTQPGAAPSGRPDRPGGSRLPIVLIVLLAILAIVIAVVLFTVVQPGPDETPSGVAREFVTRLQHGQYDRARDLLCDDGRSQLSTGDALRDSLRFDPTDITGRRIDDVTKQDGSTAVTVELEGVPSLHTLTLDVVEQHGHQAVCGIE